MLIASYSPWRFQSWIYILFRVYQRKHTIGVWEWERKTTNIFNMAELFKTASTTIHQGIKKLNFHTHWFPHSGFQYNGWGFLWFSLFALPYLCNVFVYWFGLSLIQFSPCLICISTIVFISYLYVATVYIIYIVASYDWVNHAHIFSILTLWLSQTYIVPQLYVFLCNIFLCFGGLNTFWICWWNFTWKTKEPLIPKFGHGNFQFGSLLNIFRNIPLEKLFVLSAPPIPIILCIICSLRCNLQRKGERSRWDFFGI